MSQNSPSPNAGRVSTRTALVSVACLIIAICLAIIGTRAARLSGGQPVKASARQQREPQADSAARTSLQRLRANGGVEVEAHASVQTAKYNFVRGKNNGVLVVDDVAASPEARAFAFLSEHGGLVGLNQAEEQSAAKGGKSAGARSGVGSQLAVLRVQEEKETGTTHVRLTQSYAGLPVFGAQLIVHMDKRGILGVNGNFVPEIHVSASPRLDQKQAGVLALAALRKKIGKANLTIAKAELNIYRIGLLEGFPGENVLAYNVEVRGEGKLREQVWINAKTGALLNQISLNPDALYRIAYTPQYDPNNPDMFVVRREGDPPIVPPPGPPSAIDNLYDFTGQTYNFYASAFGRDSYDALGKTMRTVLLANERCPNAYWNGSTTNYCPGFDEDDVVSHEWSHAYTEYTHGLIYAYQSGALNESYSDIFGETVDLLNGVDGSGGSDNVNHAEYGDVNGNIVKTGGGERFQLGEDFQGLNQPAAGILRDMYTPTAFGNADKVSSPLYSCGAADNGGVHNNSGVPNHAYALAVDGGTFNGQTITGIGLTKAAAIYFRAESIYQHPTTNFAEHQTAIETSCSDLVGQTIYILTTNSTTHSPSVEVITPADCAEVHKAMLAVEMSSPPSQCNFPPLLDPDTPVTCAGSSTVFNEDWQTGFPHGWTLESVGVNAEWNSAAPNHNWVVKSTLPDGHPGSAAFASDDPSDGGCEAGNDQSGHFSMTSPTITVPAGADDLRLNFDHFVETEAGFDGGNVLISVNGGSFALIPTENYVFNGPNAPLNPAISTDGSNNTNPKAGEDAWTGSNISTGDGSWGTTIVDLSSLTNPGDTIKLQFDFGKDGCGGGTGWYVDNVRVYSCPQLESPVLSLGADYENPDTNGSYTLNWTSIAGTGPYVVQQSSSSCAPLFADNAESGLGQWTTSTTGTGAVNWTTSSEKPQHAGTTFYARGVEGVTNAEEILTLNQVISVPQVGQTFLNFSDWDDNEGDDNVYVEASEDGTTWTQIYSHNRSETGTGALSFATEDLFQRHVSLANFGGKDIHLRFRLALGPDDRPASTPFGWYVDDITLVNDNWIDVASNAGTSLLVSGQTNGTRCYRVRTTYTFGSEVAPGPYSNQVTAIVNTASPTPSPSPSPNACVPPGIQVLTDPEGDEFGHVGTGADPNESQDILIESIAEQYDSVGAGTLVFTMKVPAIDPANLTTNASWTMFFDGKHADNTTTTYFVSADMNSLANPAGISYNYGFYDTTTGFNTTVGTADAGSISAVNKTISVSLRMDKITKPIPGTGQQTLGGPPVDLSAGKVLTNVNAMTSILIGVIGNGTNQTIDTTSNQSYTIAGAAACAQPSPSPSASPTPTPDNTGCTLPGRPVLIDSGNDATDALASHEIESLSIAEPFLGNNIRKLVFTLKMKDLNTLTPNTAWPIFFSTPSASYYVDMQTDAANAVSFKYGTGPANGRVASGDLDAESNYDAATGKITLYISTNKLGGIARPDPLSNIYVRVTLDATALFVYPDSAPSSNPAGSTASYTLVGNDFCGGNVAPTANLFGAPTTGPAPLVVAFDASGSLDPDDGIASYTFDFGDGSAPFTQAGPQISHRYDNAGVFIASVIVTDNGGQSSYNTANVIVSAGSSVAPPGYQIYQAPNGVGTDAGEPSLGTNWQSGRTIFLAGLQTLRITFDDCFSPASALWQDISAANTSKRTLDPILFTDHMRVPGDTTPNRTIVSQLSGTTSLSSFTDDDGGLWVPNQGGSGDSGVDHQTVGGGPFHAPLPPNPVYPNAIYYCSQDLLNTAFCALSIDGGATYGSSVPIYTVAEGGCGGLHGHVKVAPNGTVYVPNKSCNGLASVVRSTDNGINWSVKSVPDSGTTGFLVDPSLGIGSDGTLYLGYQNTNGHGRVAVSTDEGDSWIHDVDVAGQAGIANITFPEVVGGDGDRAAFAFLGTSTAGNYTLEAFDGVWYLYVATTFNRGQSWTVVNATPNDPVQRGSICNLGTTACSGPPVGSRTKSDRNLLDFMDATVDAAGRVLIAYPDGCITSICIQGGDVDGNGTVNNNDNDFSAKATIARQSAGKRLFAAFDPPDPSVPGMPGLTAVKDTAVHLSWSEPANGGLPITSYRVYRRADGAAQKTQIASTDSSTRSYDDLTADPNTIYHYLVTAVNAVGESVACLNAEVVPLLSADPCSLPGVLLMTDAKGDNVSAVDGSMDILAAYISEPYEAGQPDKLVWTLKLADLNTIVPNRQWYIIWTPPGTGLRKYVAAKSDAAGALSYEYGEVGSSSVGDPNINTPMPQGAADAGSVDRANGTFTITIANNKVGSPGVGATLLTISPRSFAGTGNQNVISTSADDLTTNTPSYTLVGNNFCRPQTPPTAALSATVHGSNPPVLSGPAPLMVDFDASASSDPDAGDTPLTYTFDFGDGSNVVTQTSPTTTHTYNDPATYRATLTVKDARGQTSLNIADIFITVGGISIGGEVVYALDPSKKVPDVTMSLTGNNNFPTRTTMTSSAGSYALTGVPAGNNYTLTPSKAPSTTGLESFDASNVARYVAGLDQPSANQTVAGDADGDGLLTSLDASFIARKVAGFSSDTGIVGTWKFLPVTRSYPGLSTDQTAQDFSAILVGETSGNWSSSGPAPGDARVHGGGKPASSTTTASAAPASPTVTVNVSLPHVPGAMGSVISVPMTVGDVTGQAVRAYDLQVTFNAAIIKPCVANECGGGPTEKPFDKNGTLSQDMTVTANTNNTGHLILSAFQTDDMIGSGTLINLRFHVVGAPGQNSPLTFEDYTDPNPTFHPGFRFNAGNPQAATTNGSVTVNGPTASTSSLSGRVTTIDGAPLGGVLLTLNGPQTWRTMSRSDGSYRFPEVQTGAFYTVTPLLANYDFSPTERSFSLSGNRTDAMFTGAAGAMTTANPLDTAEYFVRQQYLDFLEREPDQSGFEYWSEQLRQCGADEACVRSRRIGIASAFFIEREFQDTGLFIYDLYSGSLGRRPVYAEYAADRRTVVGGSQLEGAKQAFAESFVSRTEFMTKYQSSTTGETFVTQLLQEVKAHSGVDLSGQRENYLNLYRTGSSLKESRALVVRALADEGQFKQSQYNAAFVLAEYFGYLRREPDADGYAFWLNVLNSGDGQNYRGMVCSFVTSAEYQHRFATVVTRNNTECR